MEDHAYAHKIGSMKQVLHLTWTDHAHRNRIMLLVSERSQSTSLEALIQISTILKETILILFDIQDIFKL